MINSYKFALLGCLIICGACGEPAKTNPISQPNLDMSVDFGSIDQDRDLRKDLLNMDMASDEGGVDQTVDIAMDVSRDLSPADQTPDLVQDIPPDMPRSECGNGLVEPGEECDDANISNGDTCTSTCKRAYACRPLPVSSCDAVESTTPEHTLKTIPSCPFGLTPWSGQKVSDRRALIQAIGAKAGDTQTIKDVLGDLNRSGTSGITTQNADRLKNHMWSGFRWNSGDMGVSYWYPQGITGTADATSTGKLANKHAVLVSWYHKTDERPTKGVRISLADITNINNVTYRHLLLVEPTGTTNNPSFKPVETASGNALHAGGIVWWGDMLYVADTTGGLRVFDLSNIIKMTHFDNARIGISNNRLDAHGYKYAVPELMRYTRHKDSCPVRYSFVSLDRSSSPPVLVTGEYKKDHPNGRVVTWGLDPQTGALDVRQGEVRALSAYIGGQTRMQGATQLNGNLYISSSSQYQQYGRLYRTKPGKSPSSISAWVYGAEDLYVDAHNNMIWTAAEHPNARDVVGIPIRTP